MHIKMLADFFSELNFFRLTFLFLNVIFAVVATVDPYSDNWGVTQINAIKESYSWTISNYSLNDKETYNSLRSPDFKNDISDSYSWNFYLYPKGYSLDYKEYLSFMIGVENVPTQLITQYNVSIVDGSGQKLYLSSGNYIFNQSYPNTYIYYFISIQNLNDATKNLLPDDRLSIVVDIIINNGTSNISGERCTTLNNVSNAQPIQKFFEDDLFSDVELNPYVSNQLYRRSWATGYPGTHLRFFMSLGYIYD